MRDLNFLIVLISLRHEIHEGEEVLMLEMFSCYFHISSCQDGSLIMKHVFDSNFDKLSGLHLNIQLQVSRTLGIEVVACTLAFDHGSNESDAVHF